MDKRKISFTLVTLAFILSITAGCGNSRGGQAESSDKGVNTPKTVDMSQPITLKFEQKAGEAIFTQEIGDRLKKKFPNITVQSVFINKSLQDGLSDLVASGDVPDLFWLGVPNDIGTLKTMNMSFDLNNMIKRDKYDMSRFEEAAVTAVANQSDKGEMLGLPWQTSAAVLLYNKDLFDKFGVPYPKDGMTWSEAFDLGKRLTRTENGTKYRGFDAGLFNYLWSEYGLAAYDAKTFKSTFMTEPRWKNILLFFQQVYTYPGNAPASIKQDRLPFVKDKTLAMLPWAAYFQPFLDAQKEGLNFDIASLPTWPDAKGQGISPEAATLAINPQSKYKDQAFEILKYLESDEVQTANSRIGFPPAIKLQSAKDQFGKDLPGADKLNMKAVFYNKPTPPAKVDGVYENLAEKAYMQAITDVGSGSKDVNTALRSAADAADKAIADQRTKK